MEYPPKKKRRFTKDAIKRMEMEYNTKFEHMKNTIEQMQARLDGVDSLSSPKGDHLNPTTPQYPVDLIEEVTKCKIVVPVGTQTIVVARGQAFPPSNVQTVHGITRPHDYTRVQIDFVYENFVDYPLPVPIKDDDRFTLGSVKNFIVLWLKSGIKLDEVPKELTSPQQSLEASPTDVANHPSTQNSGSTTLDPSTQLKICHVHQWLLPMRMFLIMARVIRQKRKSIGIRNARREFMLGQPMQHITDLKKMGNYSQSFHKWYMAMSTTRTSRRQHATHFMVRYGEHDFHTKTGVRAYSVEFCDIFHLYNDQAIVISLHRSWILYMTRQDKYRSLVGYLDPEMVVQERINKEPIAVASYIVQALLAQQDKKCIFAVCQQGYHWVLFAIFPKRKAVYIIDSLAKRNNTMIKDYSFVPLFDRAFLTYVEKKRQRGFPDGSVVSWHSFQAHTQSNVSSLCGQYVMRHMLSFVDQLSNDPNRYPEGRLGFASAPFLPKEIADVRERLLQFFMMEVVDIGGSCRVDGVAYN